VEFRLLGKWAFLFHRWVPFQEQRASAASTAQKKSPAGSTIDGAFLLSRAWGHREVAIE
jgi:hypothetical protein